MCIIDSVILFVLLLSQLEFFTLNLFYILLLFLISISNAITLLIISEFVWVCIVMIYLLCGYLTNSFELFVVFIILLVFATVDCCIWLYILICLHKINTLSFSTSSLVSFFYRARTNLLLNNFIV